MLRGGSLVRTLKGCVGEGGHQTVTSAMTPPLSSPSLSSHMMCFVRATATYKSYENSRHMQKLINKKGAKTKKQWYKPHLGESMEIQTKSWKKSISHGHSVRLRQLNHVLYDKVTEIINTGELSQDILEKHVSITAVKMSKDMNTINVFWDADRSDWQEVEGLVTSHGGKLRSLLISYHVLGRIPHVVFVKDRTAAGTNQLARLFEQADYGSDYTLPSAGTGQENDDDNDNNDDDDDIDDDSGYYNAGPEQEKSVELLRNSLRDDLRLQQQLIPKLGEGDWSESERMKMKQTYNVDVHVDNNSSDDRLRWAHNHTYNSNNSNSVDSSSRHRQIKCNEQLTKRFTHADDEEESTINICHDDSDSNNSYDNSRYSSKDKLSQSSDGYESEDVSVSTKHRSVANHDNDSDSCNNYNNNNDNPPHFRSDLYGLDRKEMMKKILAKKSSNSRRKVISNVNIDSDNRVVCSTGTGTSENDRLGDENTQTHSLDLDIEAIGGVPVPVFVSPVLTKMKLQKKLERKEKKIRERMLERDSLDL